MERGKGAIKVSLRFQSLCPRRARLSLSFRKIFLGFISIYRQPPTVWNMQSNMQFAMTMIGFRFSVRLPRHVHPPHLLCILQISGSRNNNFVQRATALLRYKARAYVKPALLVNPLRFVEGKFLPGDTLHRLSKSLSPLLPPSTQVRKANRILRERDARDERKATVIHRITSITRTDSVQTGNEASSLPPGTFTTINWHARHVAINSGWIFYQSAGTLEARVFPNESHSRSPFPLLLRIASAMVITPPSPSPSPSESPRLLDILSRRNGNVFIYPSVPRRFATWKIENAKGGKRGAKWHEANLGIMRRVSHSNWYFRRICVNSKTTSMLT